MGVLWVPANVNDEKPFDEEANVTDLIFPSIKFFYLIILFCYLGYLRGGQRNGFNISVHQTFLFDYFILLFGLFAKVKVTNQYCYLQRYIWVSLWAV